MAKQDTLPPKSKKFFFDVHNFDEEETEVIEEEVEPPPPVFSEEELEAARKNAFEEGRQQGLGEAEQSREKHVTVLLEAIKNGLPALLEKEDRRITLYEEEAVHLAHKIFGALFPALNERQGLEEVRSIIGEVLKNQHKAPEIIIEVPTGYGEDIQGYIDRINSHDVPHGLCVVKENESLNKGDCRLNWKDGGAVRDIEAVKQEIEKHFQQILAGGAHVTDNELKNEKITHAEMTEHDQAKAPKIKTPEEPTPTKDNGE